MINTKAMREKYASNNGRAPAGAVDVRALCDEIDELRDHKQNCDTCKHKGTPKHKEPCRTCVDYGNPANCWEAAT